MMSVNGSWLRIVVLAALFMQTSCGGRSDEKAQERAYVRLPRAVVTPEFIMQHDFIPDHRRDDVFVFGYLAHEELERVRVKDREQMVELDPQWSRADFDAKTLQTLTPIRPFEEMLEGYHNYAQLTEELQNMVATYPDLVTLETAGKSVNGRELWYVKISDNAAQEENEPKLLYIANMHGDEVVGRELMIYLIRQLVTEFNSNPRINKLVSNAQIYIMPSMNPDGFESGNRENANGADLNREFPDFDSDRNDTPDRRPKEVQAIMALHAKHHFVLALNFHGGDVCFNLPWDTRPNTRAETKFADDALIYSLGREYADANATMRNNTKGSFKRGLTYGYEWYEINGGMQDWSIFWRRSIHATVELSTAKWPNSSGLPRYWNENKESMLRFLEQGTRGVHLAAVDASGQPLTVPITLKQGRRSVTYDNAYINRPSTLDNQTVTLSAPGFQDMTLNQAGSYFLGTYAPVQMEAVR